MTIAKYKLAHSDGVVPSIGLGGLVQRKTARFPIIPKTD